jgi:hypothetical protein
MRQTSATIQGLLMNPLVNPFFLVKIDTYLTTSFYRNLTMDNGETYVADGKLIQVDPPRISSTVDREIYRVVLADPSFLFGETLEANLIGKLMSVRLGFVNTSTKAPYTEIANTIVSYQGMIESSAYEIDLSSQGENKLVISGSSPMGNLDAVNTLTSSKTALRYIDLKDNSFEQIYEGSGSVVLKWGKA